MRSARRGDRTPAGVFALVALLTPLAWFLRFVQDDAFISFRYARHLVDGHGLVFSPGMEAVEGYTNFLWTVLIAGAMSFGVGPVAVVYAAGLVLFPIALLGTYRFGCELFASRTPALVALLLVGTNFSFASYATGGLETMLQTALVVWAYAHTTRAWREGELCAARAALISVLAALAGMTRLDSALLLLPAGVMCALVAGRSVRTWAALLVPVGLLIGGWFAWKASYYGALLPNTFEAKRGASWTPIRGAWYIASWTISYGLVLVGGAALLRKLPNDPMKRSRAWVLALALPIALWCAYVVYAGGDFMEFRFLVALTPFVMLALASRLRGASALRIAIVVGLVLMFSIVHGVAFDRSPFKRGLESIPQLAENLDDAETGWLALGDRLGADLGGDDAPTIALTPAGAIAYRSGLPVVDMIGLNDRNIAREGVFLSNRAGHRKIASVDQLVRKGAHLLVGHPQAFDEALLVDGRVPVSAIDPMFLTRGVPDPASIPDDARVVVFPASADDDGPRVYALQLLAHPRIDALVASGAWTAYDIGPVR